MSAKFLEKKFTTAKAVYGHQRIHSWQQRIPGLKNPRVCSISTSIESEAFSPLRRGYKATSSLSRKGSSSFMTKIEKHEMNEAAVSLVMFSEQVSAIINFSSGDIAIDLELKPMQDKIIHCVEPKQELSEVSTTCSGIVAQALPSTLRSKSQKKRERNFSYKFKICGKSFERSQTGHRTLHGSNRGQLEELEVGNSLSVLSVSGAKKVVPQLQCFEVSQEEYIELRDTNVKEHCVESRQNLSEVFSHSIEKSNTCSDVVAQALPSPLKTKLQS